MWLVVNCFRSLYLWVDLQQGRERGAAVHRCELLSFFVPLGWFTAQEAECRNCHQLWIAFVLCTFGLIYSPDWMEAEGGIVVNCFRSLYLWVDLQPYVRTDDAMLGCELLSFFVPLGWFTAIFFTQLSNLSCELLSFFVPLGWFTASTTIRRPMDLLWIAFVLCTFGLIYS